MIWFTSDTHFRHKNIIDYCLRPFSTIERMNKALIKNWNKVVKDDDLVIHVGDFGFGPKDKLKEILDQLKGKKYLVSGNHDKSQKAMLEIGFEKVFTHYVVKGEWLYVVHNAHEIGLSKFKKFTVIAGHTHTTDGIIYIKNNGIVVAKAIDVGVDANEFRPVNLDEIMERKHLTRMW